MDLLYVCMSFCGGGVGGEVGKHHTACRILVSKPGVEPMTPAGEAQSPNHKTAREVPLHVLQAEIILCFESWPCP